jgi:hypothetical protein
MKKLLQNFSTKAISSVQGACLLVMTILTNFTNGETSVTRHGITWTFSQDKVVGNFANGDWWVVGPVTITSITPAPTSNGGTDTNGTVINPPWCKNAPGFDPNLGWQAIQGWDSRIRNSIYLPSLNVGRSLPVTVQNGSSVCTCKSFTNWVGGNGQQMDTIAILTVLASPPPAGSFRPPYIGGVDKTVRWNKSQIDYSKLRKLPFVPYAPSLATVEANFEKTHIALCPSWTSDYISPLSHDNPGYGREISHKSSEAALVLNLNYTDAQKERLLINFVQRGIDIYGIMASGGGWWANGGHNHGRKMPMVMAGWVLNDATILSKSNAGFQEDQQHFFVSKADVDRPRVIQDPNRPQLPYTMDMIGTPEWSSNYAGAPEAAGSNWNVFYRYVGSSTIGNILAARLMGAMNAWNHPATFVYYDRYWGYEKGNVSSNPNQIQPFVAEMWKAYRGNGSVITPPTGGGTITPVFVVGDRFQIISDCPVYSSSAATSQTGTHTAPDLGSVLEGPVGPDSSNRLWYRANFDTGVDGWFSQANAMKSYSPPASTLAVGDTIKTWRTTWVNSSAGTTNTLGTQPVETTGVIIEGPVVNGSDNIIWFRINYASGSDGWSGADNLLEIAGSGLPTPPSAPTGLVVIVDPDANWGFEQDLASWTAAGNLEVGISSGQRVANEGQRFVVMNGTNRAPNAVLSKSVPTTAGAKYELRFSIGVYAFSTAQQKLGVKIPGASPAVDRQETITGNAIGSSLWETRAIPFTAGGTTTTIEFKDLSAETSAIDLLLDKVQVVAVP